MKREYSFEKLDVWKNAKALNVIIFKTTKLFPTNEFQIKSQINRAAFSICANIAEGSGRKKGKDQALFYKIAYSSNLELINHCILCVEFEMLELDIFENQIKPLADTINKQLSGLYKYSIGSTNGIPS
jgi:four helix bundle protein